MLTVFMIPRFFRIVPVGIVVATVALLASACEKVPLLAPSGSVITLTAANTAVATNSDTQLIAQVIEASGTPPHSGTRVVFLTTLGSIQPPEADTDINGRVVVTFKAGSANGVATISASSGGASASGANALKIAVGAAAVGGISVSASPSIVSANGGTSTITAKVNDPNGNALANVPVTFTTDAGSLGSSLVSTDATGTAQTTLTTNKTAKVTASAGVASGSGTGGTAGTPPNATVTVTVNTASTITIGAITPQQPAAGQTVSIALSYPTGSSIARLSVDWGDGRTQPYTGAPTSISHSYSAPGSYLVVITGIDSFGDSSTASTSITVVPQPRPTVDIAASASPQPNQPVTFTITATPPTGQSIASITVDFGDGTQQTLQGNAKTVQHLYASSGTFTVTAIATDTNGSSGSGSTVIAVGGGITASFTVSPASGNTTTIFSFNASDSSSPSGITSYVWDFGDGTTLSGKEVTKQYSRPATYTVRLTITDSAGRTATTTKTVAVT
jgi:PKD repeat protein